jgi:hypothetical protein
MTRRSSIRVCLVGVLALGGCGFHPDGGASGPAIDAAIDAPCVPGCAPAGDEAITCDPSGATVRTPCPYGCIDDAAGPVCARTLVPANVDPALLSSPPEAYVGGIPFEATYRIAIDTDSGAIYKFPPVGPFVGVRPAVSGISNGIFYQQVSPTLAVLGVIELRVVAGSTMEVFGSRSLVVLSRLDAIIDGTVRADGGLCDGFTKRSSCAGAGGGRGGGELGGTSAGGCAPGGNGTQGQLDTGGAGGGMATAGGAGGTSGGAAGGEPADLGQCVGETLVPLAGGGGGGKSQGAAGGGGGGGLQITAYGTLRVSAGAVVTAVGAGGQGTQIIANNGGGGGGAGGAILLEGATVDVGNGVISVAGGGGGGGRVIAADGQPGRADGQPATGGVGDGVGMTDGRGGDGAIDGAGGAGTSNAAGTLDGTGGGGGGVGRIRVNSVRGDTPRGAAWTGRYSAGRTTRQR